MGSQQNSNFKMPHQIYYKKDESKVVYEEAPESHVNLYNNNQSTINVQSITSQGHVLSSDNQSSSFPIGASLRRKTISPQT
jgi:hypothetical protein